MFVATVTVVISCLLQYLGEIEEHLGVTIDQVGPDLEVPVNDFDGKVVYGQKMKRAG